MSKSRRTCYFINTKEFWSPRPYRFFCSNKENKVLCHKAERRVVKKDIISWELHQLD